MSGYFSVDRLFVQAGRVLKTTEQLSEDAMDVGASARRRSNYRSLSARLRLGDVAHLDFPPRRALDIVAAGDEEGGGTLAVLFRFGVRESSACRTLGSGGRKRRLL